jgi:hypothetical protein
MNTSLQPVPNNPLSFSLVYHLIGNPMAAPRLNLPAISMHLNI